MESKKQRSKVAKVMREFDQGTLKSGSKKGPMVTEPAQAKAIAMSEAGIGRSMGKRDAKKLHDGVAKRIEGKKRKSAMY